MACIALCKEMYIDGQHCIVRVYIYIYIDGLHSIVRLSITYGQHSI